MYVHRGLYELLRPPGGFYICRGPEEDLCSSLLELLCMYVSAPRNPRGTPMYVRKAPRSSFVSSELLIKLATFWLEATRALFGGLFSGIV